MCEDTAACGMIYEVKLLEASTREPGRVNRRIMYVITGCQF